jgi:hypothetical protein
MAAKNGLLLRVLFKQSQYGRKPDGFFFLSFGEFFLYLHRYL